MSAAGALVVAVALAGCGTTTYFAGRVLPPSGLTNRVLIAIQNPSASTKGALQIVDAFYDIRYALQQHQQDVFHLRLFGCAARHHPEHARRAAGRGLRLRRRQSFTLINYAKESYTAP